MGSKVEDKVDVSYIPKGVCSREIIYDIMDGKVRNIRFIGGCNGNGKGIAALAEGLEIDELIDRLDHITCKQKETSCPSQLAKSLQIIKSDEDSK